ncbi:hydroxyphenylacetyl-CoA thioesterase PaaI [Herbaspirillum seropedicae]|uniref:hydroxyphenylacetyl-CoA thioesterase PaaI n=1 Tax=Herbaspirillum seropedicae TaxID=964 RepID=UPI002863BD5B|nr:hydroxyphenylacetyl-CoA thioesterase PaaI [Herbaspirillum seropedicae]MDR6396040.1 acyl-CoA thioesterase [Herbaspirillum seropedicae]
MSETALPFPSTEMDPQALAEATVQAMYPRDNASQALGMKILEIAPGRARMSMLVRSDMLNGHATCHGGFIFALADSTFAFACNSHNLNTVASGCSIEYVAPALRNDMLIAEAQERSLAGRTGVYDITVSNQDGKTIALFRGKSYRIRGEVISGLQAAQ